MPVIFSRACEYAIRGLIEMARHPGQENWKIQDLAERTNAPAPYLAKTFQTLVRSQILNSTKGRRGGFSFAVPTKNISLMDIVNIIDGPRLSRSCALGFPECGNDNECPIHEQWGAIRDMIIHTLNKPLDEFTH